MNIVRLLAVAGGISVLFFLSTHEEMGNNPPPLLTMQTQEAEAYIRTISKENGSIATWNYLKQLAENPLPKNTPEMHALAHVVGEELYISTGQSGIEYCDSSFTNGCYHGFVAAFLAEKGTTATREVFAMCTEVKSLGDCAHGVGHGFDETTGYALMESLALCDSTFKDEAKHCWEGAIMNNTESWNIKDTQIPWSVCTDIPEKYTSACVGSMVVYLHEKQHGTTPLIVEFCYAGWGKVAEENCARSFGFALVREGKGNAAHVITECKYLNSTEQDTCISAAINLIRLYSKRGWEKEVQALCKTIHTSPRELCTLDQKKLFDSLI